MVKETLLNSDIAFGERVIQRLEASGLPVSVALWLRKGEEEPFQFLLGSSLYDKLGHEEAYLKLAHAVTPEENWVSVHIRLTGTRDPLIRELRKMFGKTASVDGMRLGGQTIGGVWMDEAYVYRIR
jgi:hypothetical protein